MCASKLPRCNVSRKCSMRLQYCQPRALRLPGRMGQRPKERLRNTGLKCVVYLTYSRVLQACGYAVRLSSACLAVTSVAKKTWCSCTEPQRSLFPRRLPIRGGAYVSLGSSSEQEFLKQTRGISLPCRQGASCPGRPGTAPPSSLAWL